METPKPRAWSQQEVQDRFLQHMWVIVHYWNEESRASTALAKLRGLMHSFLAALDGVAAGLPAYEVIPTPHPNDKDYRISEGENYYEPFEVPEGTVTVHGGSMLHELMYEFGRKHGYYKDDESAGAG